MQRQEAQEKIYSFQDRRIHSLRKLNIHRVISLFLMARCNFGLTDSEGIKVLNKLPVIIQGGMGVGVSNWHLAKKRSQKQGQLGVVSVPHLGLSLRDVSN